MEWRPLRRRRARLWRRSICFPPPARAGPIRMPQAARGRAVVEIVEREILADRLAVRRQLPGSENRRRDGHREIVVTSSRRDLVAASAVPPLLQTLELRAKDRVVRQEQAAFAKLRPQIIEDRLRRLTVRHEVLVDDALSREVLRGGGQGLLVADADLDSVHRARR